MGTINFKGCEVLDGLSLSKRFDGSLEETYCWEKYDFDYLVKQHDDFSYLKIKNEPGYYEGFEYIITFENDNAYCNYNYLETEEERQDVIKELNKLKELVLKLIDNGMSLEAPGWCPAILDWQESRKRAEEIINEHILEVTERPLEDEE